MKNLNMYQVSGKWNSHLLYMFLFFIFYLAL